MPSARILLVEDDPQLRQAIERYLRRHGFEVEAVGAGRSALERLEVGTTDLVVLDVGLPDVDGLQVLSQVRLTRDVPVILLTGRGAETDRTVGLELGADDYVVKPPFLPELVARMRAVLRRTAVPEPEDQRLDFGGLVIEPATREVLVEGEPVELRQREFDLLHFLASHPRHIFTREQLLEHVWASSVDWQLPSTVTEHVRRLRQKIERDPDNPRWIRTTRGVGYRFEP